MELQQLVNLVGIWDDTTHRHDAQVRIVLPDTTTFGILSMNWDSADKCFYLVADEEDMGEL
jgi:hypothetical protein